MAKRTAEHNAKIGASLRARGVGQTSTKLCPRCGLDLPRGDFRVRPNGHTHSYCLTCERAYNAEKSRRHWRLHPENRDKQRASNRKTTLKRYHGITVEHYDEMLAQQGGACAICRGQQVGKARHLHVDHHHLNGLGAYHQRPDLVRGLLCSHCNSALGFMEDDPARLRAAADYLEGWAERGAHLTSQARP